MGESAMILLKNLVFGLALIVLKKTSIADSVFKKTGK
jgi:hypothetical protein